MRGAQMGPARRTDEMRGARVGPARRGEGMRGAHDGRAPRGDRVTDARPAVMLVGVMSQLPQPRYDVDPDHPRAPPQRVWDAMGAEERARVERELARLRTKGSREKRR